VSDCNETGEGAKGFPAKPKRMSPIQEKAGGGKSTNKSKADGHRVFPRLQQVWKIRARKRKKEDKKDAFESEKIVSPTTLQKRGKTV